MGIKENIKWIIFSAIAFAIAGTIVYVLKLAFPLL